MSDNKEVLNQEPFPSLTWDGYRWTAEIILPAWQGFLSCRGPYNSADSNDASDGLVDISVATETEQPDALLPEQIFAFQYLLKHQHEIRDAILQAIMDVYPAWQKNYGYNVQEIAKYMPDLRGHEQLRPLLGLSTVHILPVAKECVAYIGFDCACTWDDEHGFGAMTHQNRVVEIGYASVAFEYDACEKDIDPVAYENEVTAVYEAALRDAAEREVEQISAEEQKRQAQLNLPFFD